MLNPNNIPIELRGLIFLAQRFGVADDHQRIETVRLASDHDKALLKNSVLQHEDHLDAWLAGPESIGPIFSNEYIAFSAMRMASDFV